MKAILGKKIEMSQIFDENGRVTPVTKVLVESLVVTQVKNKEKDGYQAIQLGLGEKKKNKKKKEGTPKSARDFRHLREFRIDDIANFQKGQEIKLNIFEPQELVSVQGMSKGKGFQGVVRRHHFHGAPASHGTKDQLRMPGSAGPTFPQHVIKGRRGPGRMGYEKVTVKNLEVIKIDEENKIIYLKGATPGVRQSLLLIIGEGIKKKNTVEEEALSEGKEKKPAKAQAAKKK
ncbi:MAG: 50S ribosomal protein L3 [Patescibacteria group bacterium]